MMFISYFSFMNLFTEHLMSGTQVFSGDVEFISEFLPRP